ncbi:MAG: hypothetical protein WCW13_04570 [archaeon]|jgi:hypothetical protein
MAVLRKRVIPKVSRKRIGVFDKAAFEKKLAVKKATILRTLSPEKKTINALRQKYGERRLEFWLLSVWGKMPKLRTKPQLFLARVKLELEQGEKILQRSNQLRGP